MPTEINRIPFDKPASSLERLLPKLMGRGLVVGDPNHEYSFNYMRFVGGYRLKGYWHQLIDPVIKVFPVDYGFEKIDRYEFDRELRVLTMAVIERLEGAVRAVMANHLTINISCGALETGGPAHVSSRWTYPEKRKAAYSGFSIWCDLSAC